MKLLIYLIAFLFLTQPATIVKDDYDRDVSLPGMPKRIVSIAPNITEMVFAIGAGKSLVGVDSESDFPAEASEIPKVGTYIRPSLEAIVVLHPDILLVSDLTPPEMIGTIEARGIKVFVIAPKSIEGIADSMRKLGIILGVREGAEAAARQFEERIENITSKKQTYKPRVYIEYYPYFTFGPGSFGNDLIEKAGGINIGKNLRSAYSEVGNEFVVSENPEIIIVTEGKHSSTTLSSVAERPGWKNTEAVKNGEMHYMNDDLISRSGPRMADALEELYSILH